MLDTDNTDRPVRRRPRRRRPAPRKRAPRKAAAKAGPPGRDAGARRAEAPRSPR